jgi:membrane fusion protein, multidrug efflux system
MFTARAARSRGFVVLSLAPAAALTAALTLAACDRSAPGAGHGGAGPGGGGPPPAPVSVQKVAAADLPVVFEYVGRLAGAREVEVRARVAGMLAKRHFAEGSSVRRGQLLFTLEAAPFEAALAKADAAVASADARLAQATRTLDRAKSLWESRMVAQREVDDATAAEQVARADVASAKAQRQEAALNLSYTQITAPIAGTAGRAEVSEGTLVTGPTMLLASLTQSDPLKVRFAIADTDLMRWRSEAAAGQLKLPERNAFEVQLLLADETLAPQRGRLLFADARVSGQTGAIEAEAEFPNPNGALKAGQFVRVRLVGAMRPQAVKVPARAVLEGPQGKFVYVAAEGKAMPRPVTVGEQGADGWIITKGLAGGDALIVDGMARIFFPGAPIMMAPASAPASAPAPAASK